MSRGPGKWERLILAELASHRAFYLRALLGPCCTRAQYNALFRAALTLEAGGRISVTRFVFGAKTLVVHRTGTMFTREDRRGLDRISVGKVASVDVHNANIERGI